MTTVLLKNVEGKIVAPEAGAFQAAAANADWSKAPGYYLVLVDQAGAASWPITGASFILVHATPKDPAAVATALTFFAWAYASGGDMAAALDYVPLPASVVKMVENTWVSSITAGGKPVWTGK
jgi:phosphate transport system substrate-binding protein